MSQEYWTKRFEALAIKAFKTADKSEAVLARMFRTANADMRKQINDFYGKYGKIELSPVITTLSDGSEIATTGSKKLIVPVAEANKYNRLVKLESQLNETLKQLARDQNSFMYTTLGEIGTDSFYQSMFIIQSGYGIGSTFKFLDPKAVKALIENPVMGQNFSTRIWNNRRMLANVVNQELRNGIVQGIGNKEMSKRVAKRMNSGLSAANRLIQTEVTNTLNQATMLGYKESGLVKKYEYLATLDSRTSRVCQTLDGKVFPLEKAVVGLNYPPMHPNCRSTTTSKFDDSIDERRARDIQTGRTFTVPSNMDYPNYKAIYIDGKLSRSDWNKGKRA